MKVTTQTLTDTELVHAFQAGDDAALQQIVYRHKDRIYTTIYMLVKDKYLAEDIFQDAFLKMIRHIREGLYAEQGKFLPWACRIAHNLCMDHFRRVRRKIPVTLASGEDIVELLAERDAGETTEIETKQTAQTLRQLLELLPEEQREVIVMRVYGEMSFKEIASTTQVSINTALGRMRYGLLNLRKMIGEKHLPLR